MEFCTGLVIKTLQAHLEGFYFTLTVPIQRSENVVRID